MVQKFFGIPRLFWDLGGHRTLLHTMNSSMQIINYKIYVDSCYYTVNKFRKSFFKKVIVPGALKRHLQDKFPSFFNLDSIRLSVPQHITGNKHISYKTNSTRWNLKSTKSHCGISRKSVVIYNMHSPEGNYFRRGEGKLHFWEENLPNSIK